MISEKKPVLSLQKFAFCRFHSENWANSHEELQFHFNQIEIKLWHNCKVGLEHHNLKQQKVWRAIMPKVFHFWAVNKDFLYFSQYARYWTWGSYFPCVKLYSITEWKLVLFFGIIARICSKAEDFCYQFFTDLLEAVDSDLFGTIKHVHSAWINCGSF